MTDIISSLGLTAFPIAGLVIFLAVFLAVVFRVARPSRKAELERAGLIPLTDEIVGTSASPAPTKMETRS
jgi:cbb3-type cytochrome oxidase subunit 3